MTVELAIDIETYSSADLKSGAYAYSEAPDFTILLIGYKFSYEEDVHCLDLMSEDVRDTEAWAAFVRGLLDPNTLKTAYNANFERTCLAKFFGKPMPPEQWRDTMILAAQMGLPRSLAAVGAALGLPEDQQKLKTGRALIQYLCRPCQPTKANGGRTRNLPEHAPEKWKLFIEYNKQDVVTEQAILTRIGRKRRPCAKEEALWDVDQQINDRGVLLDVDLARRIIDYNTQHQEALLDEAKRITGLANPNSLAQLKPWVQSQGIPAESLTKAVIAKMLAGDLPDRVRRVLEIRQSLGKTSIKKYQTMLDIACPDGRARGIMQFYGGHTGRWAGLALQPQNLARNTMDDRELDTARALIKSGDMDTLELLYGDPSDVFSQLVRTGFIPSPGNRFVVSDFSAIEARVIAWLTGETWRLDVFKNGGDIYCESASRIYHVPVVKHGINGELRQRGKVAELALGYGGAIGAMKSMDTTGSVPEEEMGRIVQQWRAESPHIVRFWHELERKAIRCVSGDGPQTLARLRLYMQLIGETPVLRITLPYGRDISYWDPIIRDSDMGQRLTYRSLHQTTRKWERTETYGGKLTENCLSGSTIVITDQGPVRLADITPEMKVWDGTYWVSHGGLVYKGLQETISVDGVRLTPEHKIYTEKGWTRADACKGLNRNVVQWDPRTFENGLRWASFNLDLLVLLLRAEVRHVQDRARSTGRYVVCKTRRTEPVYDILNTGPQHQFYVLSENGPLLVHNCVQAIARDCLAEKMMALEARGYHVVFHVHDEMIFDVPKADDDAAGVIDRAMAAPIDWAPGLPLRGGTYECDFYRKD
jgi:DNA polymerase